MMQVKRIAEMVLLVTVGMVILAVFSGFQGVQAKNTNLGVEVQEADPLNRTVTVTGTGQVSAVPDQATIIIGVETEAETAREALSQNSEQMTALVDALVAADIPRADIQTETISLYPRYSNGIEQGTSPQVVGYTASNTVLVTVRNLDDLGPLLDTAVDAGGNRINGINFTVSDPVAATDEARSLAVQDARRKAGQLADLTDSQLGIVVSIQEGVTSQPVPLFARGGLAQDVSTVPVEAGSQIIELNVQVTWTLTGGSAGGGTPPVTTPAATSTP